MTTARGLYWFAGDLRLADNPLLNQAAAECRELTFVTLLDERLNAANRYQLRGMGSQRRQFLIDSVAALRSELAAAGHHLIVLEGRPTALIPALVAALSIDGVYRSEPVGWDEWRDWRDLVHGGAATTRWQSRWQHTLLRPAELPFAIEQLPASFSKFRRAVEPLSPAELVEPASLPAPLAELPVRAEQGLVDAGLASAVDLTPAASAGLFAGGSRAAADHLDSYFGSRQPSHYKETRNALSDWASSTKFSPWLAVGSLSPRQVAARVAAYEAEHGANESTYWIIFELLWRDYFQFYSYRYGAKLFAFGGIERRPPLTSFYPQRFAAWCHGATDYPLVNAAMNELRATGYLSNRARQIVASCLVHELGLDWRYGAAYFEQQLVDYDVASNWGNWQYIAGVGADPRGGRHFSLAKQAAQYDPDGVYVERWQGAVQPGYGDAVDAVDWPRSADG